MTATASMSLGSLTMLGGRTGQAAGAMTLPSLAAGESKYEAYIGAGMTATTSSNYFDFTDVVIAVSFSATTTSAYSVLKSASMTSTTTADATLAISATLVARIDTYLSIFAGVPILTDTGEVWAVNEYGASTKYENYSFNSFAKHGGKYLGVRPDGVYLLEGDTDAGAPVRSSISMGRQDFGTTAMKSVQACYIGVASTGNLFLRVTADGVTYTYKTNRSATYLAEQRITTGRGFKANYLTFEIYNETGADFELASVEFEAAVLSRRI